MSTYQTSFARVFDRIHGPYTQAISNFYIQLYNSSANFEHKKSRHILELCCGTGNTAQMFLMNQFNITCIDNSPAMLEIAKAKNAKAVEAGKCTFIETDVKNFQLNEQFGLVVSTGESLNHLRNLSELHNCFQQIYAHLIEGGQLYTDFTTVKGIQETRFRRLVEDEDYVLNSYASVDEEKNESNFIMTGFIKNEDNDDFKRFYENHKLYAYYWKDIEKLLKEVGFKNISLISQVTMQALSNPETEGRFILKATK